MHALSVFAFVKFRIEGIEIFGIQMILYNAEPFTETLEMDDFPCAQEADGIAYFLVVD